MKKREISAAQSAEILGVSDRYIREAVSTGKIRAKKVGRKWFIDEASVFAFRDSRLAEVSGTSTTLAEVSSEVKGTPSGKTSAADVPRIYNDTKSTGTPEKLVCFRLAVTAFDMPAWKNELQGRLKSVEEVVFAALGSGYYSYGRKKHEYYGQARAEVGAALALIYRRGMAKNTWKEETAFLETKLLPAFASLIKRVEKMGRKDRTDHLEH